MGNSKIKIEKLIDKIVYLRNGLELAKETILEKTNLTESSIEVIQINAAIKKSKEEDA